jgi:hypothetical protein
MCVAVAAQRALHPSTRHSARIHLDIAHSVSTGRAAEITGFFKLVGCRLAGTLLGSRAPYVPRPVKAL